MAKGKKQVHRAERFKDICSAADEKSALERATAK